MRLVMRLGLLSNMEWPMDASALSPKRSSKTVLLHFLLVYVYEFVLNLLISSVFAFSYCALM